MRVWFFTANTRPAIVITKVSLQGKREDSVVRGHPTTSRKSLPAGSPTAHVFTPS